MLFPYMAAYRKKGDTFELVWEYKKEVDYTVSSGKITLNEPKGGMMEMALTKDYIVTLERDTKDDLKGNTKAGRELKDFAVNAYFLKNNAASGNFIAPFSSLGKADTWETGKWQELVGRLSGTTTLLALENDRTAAEALARELGIPCSIVKPEDISTVLGPNSHLYAVDGILPQLAALVGCSCSVIMASRLAAVYAPHGENHHSVYRHTPCHPCYAGACDQQTPCTAGVSVDDLLNR
jgi:ADP-heptose:LPS heptosyltransferase